MASVLLPFRYAGGKFYALNQLRPFWNAVSHEEYREPMAGGASVFFAKPKAQINWLNDIDQTLITTYRVMADPNLRSKLIELVSGEEATPERHSEIKSMLPSNDLETAFKYYYLNRTSFSGKMKVPSWGYRPKRSLPPDRWAERIIPTGKKLENVKLTSLDFAEVIRAPSTGSSVLMYLDPPYYHAKQVSHYSFPFQSYDHKRLADLLRETDFSFFLTYDDCSEIRDLYNWANIYEIEFYYRIENSRFNEGKRKKVGELVITNYKIQRNTVLDEWTPSENILTINGHPKNYSNENIRILSPFRFPGSKGRSAKIILPFIYKVQHDEYREPFFGGGGIFFAKNRTKNDWINDIDSDLITTLKVMADPELRRELIEAVTNEVASKKRHLEIKYWHPLSQIDIAHKFYYLSRTSYSGIVNKPAWGFDIKKSVPPEKWGTRIEEAGRKLSGVRITNLDFSEVIKAKAEGDQVLMYLDPPYYKADQKRAYSHSFRESDHLRLRDLLKETNYSFVLTYDNVDEVKELYDWANIHEVTWRYHTANAAVADRKMGRELIITNM